MLGGAQTHSFGGMPGEHSQLGKYQLLRRIATGGMAELFLARATAIHGFEKLVVLKRILPQHAESDDFIRMFLAEARLAATLHHPNIVQVYDIGEEGSTYFFTMEYVQGQDLRRLVRAARKANKALPLEHILHIVMGVAAGLNHAHEKIGLDGRPLGIVHRDVSPSNVLVTYEGGVKIVDFGIAKAATAQSATIAGTLKGKIPYMSPEQCRGEAVDRRSDIFSIGTLLWELTTGARLFTGENEFSIINRVAAGDVPPPSSVRADYPPELEAIVMRALQAERDNRYASAQDLQIDLEDFAREARLPVSSARMAKFMRELFSEEIRQTTLMLSERLDEQPTMRRPALSREMLEAAGLPPLPPAPNELESVELTPSEVRADQVMATPGPVETTYATDVTYEERKPSYAAVVLAVITGMIAVLGVATFVWFFVLAEEKPGKKKDGEQDRTPAVIVESPTPDEPAPEPEPEPEVEPTGADAEPLEPVGEAVDPAADGTTGAAEEPEPEADADSGAAESSIDPKDDKTGDADDSPKRGGSKRGGKRGGTKGSSGSKPKWDPDSPFPI